MNNILKDAVIKAIDSKKISKDLNKYSNKQLEIQLKEINDMIIEYEIEIAILVGIANTIDGLMLDENRKRTKWQKFWYGE